MNIRQNLAYSGNFTAGRQGQPTNKIFIHHAATTDFDGIARTFQKVNRGASAHYGVGRNGKIDQYVPEGSIAWHCGNWPYNQTSIGIENVNSGGAAQGWPVAEDTFDTLVELVTDIARRHGMLPLQVGKNLFGHKDVSATACPGVLHGRLQELADRVNRGAGSSAVPGNSGKKSNDTIASEVLAGQWGNGDARKANLKNAGYDFNTIQAIVNARLGAGGNKAPAAPQKASVTTVANQVIAGSWGNGDARKANLERAGYNYNEVQGEVNRLLGIKSAPAAPARKDVNTVAREVVRGEWGNGEDRKNRLRNAGYDYAAVQRIVNTLV